jgi:protein involved in polysaccharide export with SLBB domain
MIFFIGFLILGQPLTQYLSEGGSIRIQVWGEVKAPGIYYVTPSTNIVEAISFAGGPTPRADLSCVRLVRAIRGKEVSFYNVNDYLSAKNKNPPMLESGDLVYVTQSFSSKVYDFAKFLGVVGAVAYYLYRLAPTD